MIRGDAVFSGRFVKVTFGWNRTRNLDTYKIQIQEGLTDSNYPRDGKILVHELIGAAEAIRSHQSELSI
jgi:hypothetical protein